MALLALLRDRRGASAVEFALILPLFLLFLLGTIDAGRYIWAVNQAEKSTQIGARWAVATQLIPGGNASNGLLNYDFVGNGGVETGTTVGVVKFPGVYCMGASTAVTPTCTCKGTCSFSIAANNDVSRTAWANLIARMRQVYPDADDATVRIDCPSSEHLAQIAA